jgi:uncharacterized protein YvpB
LKLVWAAAAIVLASALSVPIYEAYSDGVFWRGFDTLEAARQEAGPRDHIAVRLYGGDKWVWDNYPPFDVFTGNAADDYAEFETFKEAVGYARAHEAAFIYHWDTGRLLWDNARERPEAARAEAPYVAQLPELPRGCEVTSLAMLLQSQGIDAGKMELAERVRKDTTDYQVINGRVFYGNPHLGFVGRMDNLKTAGYGVYHEPICALLSEYLPAVDLTGCEFDDLLYYPSLGLPVWIITNSTFKPLPETSFTTWQTDLGEIEVTYREHSVLVTGYDGDKIYINDPLNNVKEADKGPFAAAWEQMGRQAVGVKP